jgi:adenylylsulfate kinase-like enzyme
MSRDQKNLFGSEGLVTAEQRWALAGHRGWVVWLTGLDAPYEAPAAPDIHVRTAEGGIGDCVAQILVYLLPRVRLAAG